jgi:hypothetical protein
MGRIPRAFSLYAGFVVLGSGVALLSNLLFGVPLLDALVLAILIVAASMLVLVRRAQPDVRDAFFRLLRTGLIAGFVATLAYDTSKAILSIADPSPYNPFEAVRIFGALLIGESAPPTAAYAVGAGYHLLNGVMFAVAFTQFLGPQVARSPRRAILLGMLWGLFLETFQLTLFPGWLSIKFVAEFATISFAAHLVYGATLGLIVRRRREPGPASSRTPA